MYEPLDVIWSARASADRLLHSSASQTSIVSQTAEAHSKNAAAHVHRLSVGHFGGLGSGIWGRSGIRRFGSGGSGVLLAAGCRCGHLAQSKRSPPKNKQFRGILGLLGGGCSGRTGLNRTELH